MEGRVRHLEALLATAEIVEADEGGSTVATGSVVTVRYAGDPDTERFLLGSIEERHDELEVMSPGSPLGQALMGARAGAAVSFKAPTGATLEVEVVAID